MRLWRKFAKVAVNVILAFVFANVALAVAGLFVTAARRYDDDNIKQVISDGIQIAGRNGDVVLTFACKGHTYGYEYWIGRRQLRVSAALDATAPHGEPLDSVFPVSKDQLIMAAGLAGGSAGAASALEKLRMATLEREFLASFQRDAAMAAAKAGAETEGEAVSLTEDAERVKSPTVAIAVAVIGGGLSGYALGGMIGRTLGLDVNCGSNSMHEQLRKPAVWRQMLGTVFTHAFASLQYCIEKGQLRTDMRGDSHVGLAFEKSRGPCTATSSSSSVADSHDSGSQVPSTTAAASSEETACGSAPPERYEEVGVSPNGDRMNLSSDSLTEQEMREYWTERVGKSTGPFAESGDAERRVAQREFPPRAGANPQPDAAAPAPTAADVLVNDMARLGQGHLLNEQGEATIGVDDLQILLKDRQGCESQHRVLPVGTGKQNH